ncbi:MAG: hypothetical protein FJY82_01360 [Candidatus Aminicenantes bacterium]|nr:hypothetical protein [Candidatus Aminicenantes bacterium]
MAEDGRFGRDHAGLRAIPSKSSRHGIIFSMWAKGFERFFWDADLAKLDLERHKTFVIERILELGDEAAVRQLLATYSRLDILRVLRDARSLSPKSHGFWTLVLGNASDG